MSWVVASKIVLRVAVMIVDFVGRDYLGIEIRDPSGTIGNEGWRESGGCRGVSWIVTLRVVRPQLNCGNEIAGLGLLGLFFWWGVMCAGLYCGDWGGCASLYTNNNGGISTPQHIQRGNLSQGNRTAPDSRIGRSSTRCIIHVYCQ